MLAEISATQFGDWMHYFELEPFGEIRADARQQMTCAVIANGYRDPKKKAPKLSDFALQFGGESRRRPARTRKQSPADMRAQMEVWNAGVRARASDKDGSPI